MSTSIFGDKSDPPGEKLTAALKESKFYWNDIKKYVSDTCGKANAHWTYYSKKSGWILVMKSGQRTIIYLIPQDGTFKANLVYGRKAVGAAMESDLPEHVKKAISDAVLYMEGKSFMIDVSSKEDAALVKKLIDIKHKN